MPDSLLDKIQADPQFGGLSPKGKREFLREVLGRDRDYRALSPQGQAEFANEIYRRYPDTTATAAPAKKRPLAPEMRGLKEVPPEPPLPAGTFRTKAEAKRLARENVMARAEELG